MGIRIDPDPTSSTQELSARRPAQGPTASTERLRRWLKYWAPVGLWMALIFCGSTDVGSSERSSRLIGPVLRWLFPGMAAQTIDAVVLTVRKTGHVIEYAVLTVLVWRALRRPVRHDPRPWSWRPAGLAVAVAVAYAGTDELHQAFVPSRQAQLTDLLLDAAGALAAVAALALWTRWRARPFTSPGQPGSPNPPTAV